MERRELGEGLALRGFEEADADELFALVERSRAHLARWMPWVDGHTTPADSLRFIREACAEIAVGMSLQLALVEDEEVVGITSLYAIDRAGGTCRCGYWLAPERQGRGIVTRALSSLLDHAFAGIGMRCVELRTAPDNAPSRHIAERLGFRFDGTLVDAERFGERWRDQVRYLLPAEEWRGQGRAG